MTSVTITLVGSNGDEIELADSGDYVLTTGVQGFGIPATAVRIDESAGDGGVWRHTKRGVRDLDLPLAILGTDRADVETKLRRLARLLQTTAGPTIIRADYSDGESLFLEAHYVGGAETQFGDDANGVYCRWLLQMQAPQPYWQTLNEQSFTVSSGNTGRGLLPNLAKLRVSSSQTLGVVNVNNQGDVSIHPRYVVRGPVTGLTIANGSQAFGFSEPIPAGATYTVDAETREVLNDEGENIYRLLNAAPKFFSLPPGESAVSIVGTESDENTQITVYYSPRYEVIH
jgi:hypothetical protein